MALDFSNLNTDNGFDAFIEFLNELKDNKEVLDFLDNMTDDRLPKKVFMHEAMTPYLDAVYFEFFDFTYDPDGTFRLHNQEAVDKLNAAGYSLYLGTGGSTHIDLGKFMI